MYIAIYNYIAADLAAHYIYLSVFISNYLRIYVRTNNYDYCLLPPVYLHLCLAIYVYMLELLSHCIYIPTFISRYLRIYVRTNYYDIAYYHLYNTVLKTMDYVYILNIHITILYILLSHCIYIIYIWHKAAAAEHRRLFCCCC